MKKNRSIKEHRYSTYHHVDAMMRRANSTTNNNYRKFLYQLCITSLQTQLKRETEYEYNLNVRFYSGDSCRDAMGEESLRQNEKQQGEA